MLEVEQYFSLVHQYRTAPSKRLATRALLRIQLERLAQTTRQPKIAARISQLISAPGASQTTAA